jgi:hypothetical protein
VRIPRLFGLSQGLKSLLAVNQFPALVIVKILKLHCFNSSSDFPPEVLKRNLVSNFSSFNTILLNAPKVLKRARKCTWRS